MAQFASFDMASQICDNCIRQLVRLIPKSEDHVNASYLDAEAWLQFQKRFPNAYNFLELLCVLAEGECLESLPRRSKQQEYRLAVLRQQIDGVSLAPTSCR